MIDKLFINEFQSVFIRHYDELTGLLLNSNLLAELQRYQNKTRDAGLLMLASKLLCQNIK